MLKGKDFPVGNFCAAIISIQTLTLLAVMYNTPPLTLRSTPGSHI
jgi:hypothetical protein